jgi:hypothetical protein
MTGEIPMRSNPQLVAALMLAALVAAPTVALGRGGHGGKGGAGGASQGDNPGLNDNVYRKPGEQSEKDIDVVWACHGGSHDVKVDWKKSWIEIDGHRYEMEKTTHKKGVSTLVGNDITYEHYEDRRNPGLSYNTLTMAGSTETYHCKPRKV